MATVSMVGLVVFGVLFALFALNTGKHRVSHAKDYGKVLPDPVG